MKAVGLYRYLPIDHPEALLDLELPAPVPGPQDLLVRVEAVGVNPIDYKVRAPKDKQETTPRVLGWDAAGVVEQVGAEVTLFRPGDRVYYAGDITRAGSNAQLQLVDQRIAGAMPKTLDFARAAALPLTTITAWETFFERLGIDADGAHAGQTLLIIGGAGGVGSIGIQLAKRLAGLTVITTASRPESVAWCRELGADHVIDHRGELVAQLREIGLKHVDYIACFNDTDRHFRAMAELIRPQGKIASIVENVAPLPIELLKSKSATFVWEMMFTRSMFATPDMIEQHRLLTRVGQLIDDGRLRTTLAEVMGPINAANLRRAHAQLEDGHTIGKLVLQGF
ncbi:zinc-binding alcohol dehydrogenase family protein [Chitinimonas lacunae]|uniref:Zinc-type alcohol dehydrogenase-like protein n=1 Tax=Chitinimonas lacunae TaxID=1963018 RepID=A0ABV8MSS9_9NEIS